jgi:diguanylate cyclase (GGDEF)-like protein
MLLPETQLEGAMILVNRVVASLRSSMIPHEKSPLGFVTVSAGLASYCPGGAAPSRQQLISDADVALYQAKERGRNQCVVSQISVNEIDLGKNNVVSH